METIGTLTDKLIIENIKVFRLRTRYLHDESLTEQEKIKMFHDIELLNNQRAAIGKELDQLMNDWLENKSKPVVFKRVKI